jgi:hypothetical protein
MAVTADLTVDNPTPDHGETITVTYSITGNDDIDPATMTISGSVLVGGQRYEATTTVVIPGTEAADVAYETPTCDGLTFESTSDPAAFTAVIP